MFKLNSSDNKSFVPTNKTVKKWSVHPIVGKSTFKVVEQKFKISQHVKYKNVKREDFIREKTVLTNVDKDVAERYVYNRENNIKI